FGGWAIDQAFTSGTGINAIAIYMDGDANTGKYLGQAQLGGDRQDVAAQYNNPNYRYSGWNFSLAGLGLTGTHTFTFVAYTTQSGIASSTVNGVVLVRPPPDTTTAPPPPTTGGTLDVDVTLSNLIYLFGQSYSNALATFDGYIYPGLVL